MAVQPTPYVETALSHSAELFRQTLQAGLPVGSAGGVVSATPSPSANKTAGVAGCSDLKVWAPVSGMSVDVAPGAAYVCGSLGSTWGMPRGYGYPVVTTNGGSPPTIAANAHAVVVSTSTQGTYYVYNDGTFGDVSLPIQASDPSNPRLDVVGCQVEDSSYSGTDNDWKLTVITGTAAASPAVPAFPASFLPLALVWVPANATSIVTADILDMRVAYNRNPFYLSSYQHTGGQSWPSGAVNLNIDTIAQDISGSGGTGTGNNHFTAPIAGLYLFNGEIRSSASAAIAPRMYINGTSNTDGIYTAAANIQVVSLIAIAPLSQNDTLALNVFNGGSATTSATSSDNRLQIALLSPF